MSHIHAHAIDRNENDSEINLTPMLDVVFIMLVFFIVTSAFIREFGLPVAPLPESSAGEGEPVSIVVVIDDEDEIWIDDRRIDRAAVRSNLVRLHALNPKFPVIILPAPSSTTAMLVHVIDSAMLADIEDIAVGGDH